MKPGEENQQLSTEVKEFNPTDAMQVWVDTAIEIVDSSPSAVSEKCGLDRSNWYKWLDVPGFEDWFFSQYKTKRRRWLPKLDAMGMKNAARDFNYWKDMRKAAGEVEDSKPPAAVQINFNASKYIKER